MFTSHILAKAFSLDVDLIPDRDFVCGICGYKGEVVSASRLIKVSTADVADTFRHSAFACLPCAACFSERRLLVSNIYADDLGRGLKPMVAQSSATEDRPSWRDLVTQLSPGTKTVSVFTSNTKRRLWLRAPVGIVGSSWRVLMVHESEDRVFQVDYEEVLRNLSSIENLLEEGFSKAAIKTSLPSAGYKTFKDDPARFLIAERLLAEKRNTDEFELALFIAQKEN